MQWRLICLQRETCGVEALFCARSLAPDTQIEGVDLAEVLAFGDSLTWGASPEFDGPRHDPDHRWPDVLQDSLEDVIIRCDGVRGRNTAYENGASPADLNGARSLPTALFAHAPLDAVILMLGTNDLLIGLTLPRVRAGLVRLVEIVKTTPLRVPGPAPAVLLVAPPTVRAMPGGYADAAAAKRSAGLAGVVKDVAQQEGCAWFDAGTVCQGAEPDGVHLSAPDTRALGLALAGPVRGLLRSV